MYRFQTLDAFFLKLQNTVYPCGIDFLFVDLFYKQTTIIRCSALFFATPSLCFAFSDKKF